MQNQNKFSSIQFNSILLHPLIAPHPLLVLGQLTMRTIPHQIRNKAQPLPSRTTIPRTIPHQELLPTRTTIYTTEENHSSGPKPVRWEIVLLGSCPDTPPTAWALILILIALAPFRGHASAFYQLTDTYVIFILNRGASTLLNTSMTFKQ